MNGGDTKVALGILQKITSNNSLLPANKSGRQKIGQVRGRLAMIMTMILIMTIIRVMVMTMMSPMTTTMVVMMTMLMMTPKAMKKTIITRKRDYPKNFKVNFVGVSVIVNSEFEKNNSLDIHR